MLFAGLLSALLACRPLHHWRIVTPEMANQEPALHSLHPRNWDGEFDALSAAQREGRAGPEDLEALAVAAYMTGRDPECEAAWTDAHRAWLAAGQPARAARCAFWQAIGLFFRGDLSPAMGWIARGARLLDTGECAEQAWLLALQALPDLFSGNGETVYPNLLQAEAIAQRFGDPDGALLTRLAQGYALVLQGRLPAGLALLDEIMVAVTTDEASPLLTGIAYCQVIALCNTVFDLRRAGEWTEALTRWCDTQAGLVPFRGNCLVHRCEIFQLRGAWPDALESARQACDRLAGPPPWDMLGSAYYQLGEVQRLQGEFAGAEASYRRASLAGRDPEPGLSLLRMAQGRLDLALPAIRRALDEAQDPFARARLLPAGVEVLLAAGDPVGARSAADELETIAARYDAPYLTAVAAKSSAAVLLAEGDARSALAKLRVAHRAWRELRAPREAALVRYMTGVACDALGDAEGARLEFEAARTALEALGATPDLAPFDRLPSRVERRGVLSPRESEVLVLLAAGMTNRAIATELVLSEKTIARHVSNIFTKLGLSSRAEATAYAYQHHLVR